MNDTTKKEVIDKATKKLKPYKEHSKRTFHNIIGHAGTIIPILAIILSVILFAYNKGYCGVYHLPVNVMPINLNSFLSAAYQLCGLSYFIIAYISYIKTDNILSYKRIHIMRLFVGVSLLAWTMYINNFQNVIGGWYLLIAFVIPLLFEFLYYQNKIRIKDKPLSGEEGQIYLEDVINASVKRDLLISFGLIIVIVPTLISPSFGYVTAKGNREYQVFADSNQQYAVIIDYSDTVLAQKVEVKDDTLVIDTSDYYFFSKDSRKFVFSKYDNVIFDNKSNKNIDLLSGKTNPATISEPVTT